MESMKRIIFHIIEQETNTIIALDKSMRGSDANASLFWLARMLYAGEDPLLGESYAFASEDMGEWFFRSKR